MPYPNRTCNSNLNLDPNLNLNLNLNLNPNLRSAANMFSLSQTLMLKIPGMRDFLDIPLPPPPPPPKLGEATTEDMMKNPIKSMMAKVCARYFVNFVI